jgi:hypothetical protein
VPHGKVHAATVSQCGSDPLLVISRCHYGVKTGSTIGQNSLFRLPRQDNDEGHKTTYFAVSIGFSGGCLKSRFTDLRVLKRRELE